MPPAEAIESTRRKNEPLEAEYKGSRLLAVDIVPQRRLVKYEKSALSQGAFSFIFLERYI